MSRQFYYGPRKVLKGNNRRRNGYELTRQRDMLPIILGAVFATVFMHVALYWLIPHVIEYKPQKIEVVTADNITERVVVREKPAQDTPEKPEDYQDVEPEPKEDLQAPDVDILDAQFEELIMAQTDTQLVVNAGPEMQAATIDPLIQAELQQLEAPTLQESPLAASLDEWHSPDSPPINANETAANIPPMTPDKAYEDGEIEQDLQNTARDLSYLPQDTRLLSDLLKEKELNAGSGVARLGTDLLFDFGESNLSPTADVSLQILAVLILNNPHTYFIIEGHTDTLGNKILNSYLSLHRAARVRAWLQEAGVPIDRVYIRACAANSPISEELGDRDKERINRRVEIHMRSENEFRTKPEGCLDYKYKVDLSKPIKTLIQTNPTHPQTYPSVNKLTQKVKAEIKNDDTAETVEG